MGSDWAWMASIAPISRFLPADEESSILRLAARRLIADDLAAAEDLAGLLPFSSASSLAACREKYHKYRVTHML